MTMMRMDLDEPSTQAASLEASPTQKKKKKEQNQNSEMSTELAGRS
jgi:hypothetical protein